MGSRINRRDDARGLRVKDSDDEDDDVVVVERSDVSPVGTCPPKSGVKNKSHDANTRIRLSEIAPLIANAS